MIITADPQIPLLPGWFMDWMVRSIFGVAITHLQGTCQKPDPIFWDRYQERIEYYNQISQRIKDVLDLEVRYEAEERKKKDRFETL